MGPLFQGRYKAVLVQSTEYLLHLTRYIHRNPKELFVKDQPLISYPWSSYPSYLNNSTICWLNKELIFINFLKDKEFSPILYKSFVENYDDQLESSNLLYYS